MVRGRGRKEIVGQIYSKCSDALGSVMGFMTVLEQIFGGDRNLLYDCTVGDPSKPSRPSSKLSSSILKTRCLDCGDGLPGPVIKGSVSVRKTYLPEAYSM